MNADRVIMEVEVGVEQVNGFISQTRENVDEAAEALDDAEEKCKHSIN